MNWKKDRHHTQAVKVGKVVVGGGSPVVIQSMTNTDTADHIATAAQIKELVEAGSEIVRITVNDAAAAAAVPKIRDLLLKQGIEVPLVGCFHYNGHQLLKDFPECAEALSKYRINPGNVGFGKKKDAQFAQMIEAAIEHNKPVRIGVNWGSIDQALVVELMDENARLADPKAAEEVMREALIQSCLRSARRAEEIGLARDKIILSAKVSRVPDLIDVYQSLAERCDYALHLGLTEAGMGLKGVSATAAALAVLLNKGIGDTIRASITPEPGMNRTQEVKLCQEVLQSIGLRDFAPSVTSCPGCGRTTSSYFQELTHEIQSYISDNMPIWKKSYPQVVSLKIAVMGCIVNGPGESKHADIGISLPGNGEAPVAPVFIDGVKVHTLRGENIANDFKQILEEYICKKFAI